jgi:adenylyltransferase/sulfurtransferase
MLESRYARQTVFPPFGPAGQAALAKSRVLLVGAGGLGTWIAELLTRAGVGFLRVADQDLVELTNIQRQALYEEADAAANRFKVEALAAHLGRINSEVTVEPICGRVFRHNIGTLAEDVDLIIDGTDNYPTRFVINDWAVKFGKPWIFGGVIGAEGQVLTLPAGGKPCMRCLLDEPPVDCASATCRNVGVLGPAVATIASLEAMEALKILAGRDYAVSPYLLKFNFWENTLQRVDARQAFTREDCRCCGQRKFDYLEQKD